MLYINSAPNDNGTDQEYFQYIDQATLLKGIRFENTQRHNGAMADTRCVFAKGGVRFDSVVWYNFIQAIKYTETYNDLKSVVNCSFLYYASLSSEYFILCQVLLCVSFFVVEV